MLSSNHSHRLRRFSYNIFRNGIDAKATPPLPKIVANQDMLNLFTSMIFAVYKNLNFFLGFLKSQIRN